VNRLVYTTQFLVLCQGGGRDTMGLKVLLHIFIMVIANYEHKFIFYFALSNFIDVWVVKGF